MIVNLFLTIKDFEKETSFFEIESFFSDYYQNQQFINVKSNDEIQLPDGVEMVMPGDNVEMKIKLITPVALDEQLRFAVREGGRTVGSGVITKVIE